MKTQLTTFIFCVLLVMHWSCTGNQTNQKELVLQASYSQIQDIVAIADCRSPFGKYITEVRSSMDGSCYFLQKFSDNDPPFIVKLDTDNRGYLINGQDVIIDTLSKEDVEMIRGHEIHKMSTDPGFFFTSISFAKPIQYLGSEYELYNGKDRLDNPVKLLYNRRKKIISKIELFNPKDTSQTIEIIYNKWEQSEYGDMVKEIEIVQAKKDTFYFDFKSLKIRDETGFSTVYD